MSSSSTILLGLALALMVMAVKTAWESWRSGRAFCRVMPWPYRNRESTESAWRQQMGDEMMEHADAVLTIVCETFLFNPEARFQLAPDDRISDIYRSCYPRWYLCGDAMEVERLVMELEGKRAFDKSRWDFDNTLGELVELTVVPDADGDERQPLTT